MAKPTRTASTAGGGKKHLPGLSALKNIAGGIYTGVLDNRNRTEKNGYLKLRDYPGEMNGLLDYADPVYRIFQGGANSPGTRLYRWETAPPKEDTGLGFSVSDAAQSGWGWGLQEDLDNAGVSGYTGYHGNRYFENGMGIRNTASPEHWRYKWFKQQEADNDAWRESERDRIYDLWDRGEMSTKDRRRKQEEIQEKYRMNDRKWSHGMSEGGYKVPAHIRALQAAGLLKGF